VQSREGGKVGSEIECSQIDRSRGTRETELEEAQIGKGVCGGETSQRASWTTGDGVEVEISDTWEERDNSFEVRIHFFLIQRIDRISFVRGIGLAVLKRETLHQFSESRRSDKCCFEPWEMTRRQQENRSEGALFVEGEKSF